MYDRESILMKVYFILILKYVFMQLQKILKYFRNKLFLYMYI